MKAPESNEISVDKKDRDNGLIHNSFFPTRTGKQERLFSLRRISSEDRIGCVDGQADIVYHGLRLI